MAAIAGAWAPQQRPLSSGRGGEKKPLANPRASRRAQLAVDDLPAELDQVGRGHTSGASRSGPRSIARVVEAVGRLPKAGNRLGGDRDQGGRCRRARRDEIHEFSGGESSLGPHRHDPTTAATVRYRPRGTMELDARRWGLACQTIALLTNLKRGRLSTAKSARRPRRSPQHRALPARSRAARKGAATRVVASPRVAASPRARCHWRSGNSRIGDWCASTLPTSRCHRRGRGRRGRARAVPRPTFLHDMAGLRLIAPWRRRAGGSDQPRRRDRILDLLRFVDGRPERPPRRGVPPAGTARVAPPAPRARRGRRFRSAPSENRSSSRSVRPTALGIHLLSLSGGRSAPCAAISSVPPPFHADRRYFVQSTRPHLAAGNLRLEVWASAAPGGAVERHPVRRTAPSSATRSTTAHRLFYLNYVRPKATTRAALDGPSSG